MIITSKKKQIWKDTFHSDKFNSLEAVLNIITQNRLENFNATLNLVFVLNLNTKKTGQLLKGVWTLPFPRTKKCKICVFTDKFTDQATKNQPDLVAGKDFINEIAKTRKIAFDVLLATPEMMPHLNKIAKILGPKKLMPSTKNYTLGTNIAELVANWKQGQSAYSVDEYGNLHLTIGKVDTEVQHLLANIYFCYNHLFKTKPSGVKGTYIKGIYLNTTMGPSFNITSFFS